MQKEPDIQVKNIKKSHMYGNKCQYRNWIKELNLSFKYIKISKQHKLFNALLKLTVIITCFDERRNKKHILANCLFDEPDY